MKIYAYGGGMTWDANDERRLETILRKKDSRGGGAFWLADEDGAHPCLLIRVSGDLSEILYFPHEHHPGFLCVGGQGLPPHGTTLFVFDGCDPGDGEERPNDFVVPFATAVIVARDFLRDRQLPSSVQWFEL